MKSPAELHVPDCTGHSSGNASVPRTFSASGAFTIVEPREESMDIISTLGPCSVNPHEGGIAPICGAL
uniref:Uncharacterized protein n=1 Tax=Oryza sativa subsp. japonica TaxID=39947 RepID=Q84Q38_ORYSJ|nr:hypothetical protein [Oryza sativa Japonica Group]BAD01460.1 hypothetical protein [Oryza sativa Japonica Group]